MEMGDLRLTAPGIWSGMVGGDLIVAAGIDCEIAGMVRGDVIAEAGARVRMTGLVGGDIIRRG